MNTDREDLRLLITEFNDGPMGSADDFAWRRHLKTYEDLLAEVKRLREERDELIEYVIHLSATPHVLRKLWGSPSQVHTIDNLAASLYQLLDLLQEEEEE